MFVPNVKCVITKLGSKFDIHGKQIREGDALSELCAIVKLNGKSEKTSVRADSSASRGAADEMQYDARLLFTKFSKIEIGDKVELLGFVLRVESRFPRLTVHGALDHYQVDLSIWV